MKNNCRRRDGKHDINCRIYHIVYVCISVRQCVLLAAGGRLAEHLTRGWREVYHRVPNLVER